MKTRVLFVESNEKFYSNIKAKTSKEKFELEMLSNTADLFHAFEQGESPSAVILNKNNFGTNFTETVEQIVEKYPQTQIIALLSEQDRGLTLNGFEELGGETVDAQELPFTLKYCLRNKHNMTIFFKKSNLRVVQNSNNSSRTGPMKDESELRAWENNLSSMISNSILSSSNSRPEPRLQLVQGQGQGQSQGQSQGHGNGSNPVQALGFTALKRKWSDDFEKQYLEAILKRNNGNVSAAARDAKIDRSNLLRLMRRHTLKSQVYRKMAA